MEASEVAVRVRLLGGTSFEREAQGVARSVEEIGAAGRKTNLDGTLGSSVRSTGEKVGSFTTKVGKAGSTLMGLGRSLAPAAAGIAGLGYYAVKAQVSFQRSMMLLVTQAGLPRKHLQGLTKDVLALGKALGQTPNALAEGAFGIVSSGHHNPADVKRLLRLSGVMAAVGGDTVNNTATALMEIMNTGFRPKGGPAQIAAWLESTVGQGMMHLPQLTSALGTSILPLAKMTGEKLPDVLSAVAALSRQGVDPSSMLSRTRLSLTSVTSPTAQGLKAMSQMGLSPYALAHDIRHGGLLAMLQDMKTHTGNMTSYKRNDLIAEIFGKSRGIGNIGALLQALPQMQKIHDNVLHATPKLLQTHFKETKSTSAFKMAQLKAQFDKEMIKLGQVIQKDLLPQLVKLIPVLTKAVGAFNKMSPGMQSFLVKMGALIVILSPLFIMLGGLIKVIEFLKPIFMGLGEIAAYLWEFAFEPLLEVVLAVITGISATVAIVALLIAAVIIVVYIFRRQLWDAIKAVANFLAGIFRATLHTVVTHAESLWKMFKTLAGAVWKVIKFFGHLASGALHSLTHPFSSIGHFFSHIPFLADGGNVTGCGMALIGERGPELLNLPRGATVTPLSSGNESSLRVSGDGAGPINLVAYTMPDSKVIATAVAKVNRQRQNRK